MRRLFAQLIELYLSAELVWYIIHDGDERLYEYAWETGQQIHQTIVHRVQVQNTLHHIRRLPEQ